MLGGNQMEYGMARQYFPPTICRLLSSPASTPSHWKCIYPDHPGSGLIVSGLTLVYSIQKCTDEVAMAPTAACECDADEEQTADHIITPCPIFHDQQGGLVRKQLMGRL